MQPLNQPPAFTYCSLLNQESPQGRLTQEVKVAFDWPLLPGFCVIAMIQAGKLILSLSFP